MLSSFSSPKCVISVRERRGPRGAEGPAVAWLSSRPHAGLRAQTRARRGSAAGPTAPPPLPPASSLSPSDAGISSASVLSLLVGGPRSPSSFSDTHDLSAPFPASVTLRFLEVASSRLPCRSRQRRSLLSLRPTVRRSFVQSPYSNTKRMGPFHSSWHLYHYSNP